MQNMSRKFQIVGLGEIVWDILPSGKRLGGAPANFAFHAHALGGEGLILSAVGNDDFGRELLNQLYSLGLDCGNINISKHPTGLIHALISDDGSAEYTIEVGAAWDFLEWSNETGHLAKNCDAVCFGTLSQRSFTSRETIYRFLKEVKADCLRVFDINLRQYYYSKEIIQNSLQAANVFKLNDEELEVISNLFNISGTTEEKLDLLLKSFDLELLALTKGANGSIMIDKNNISSLPGKPTKVVDTIGAGDAFTAAMIIGKLNGFSLDHLHLMASSLASYICTQSGATPKLPESLIAQFKDKLFKQFN